MVDQPIEVEESLIDDVLVRGPFILDDDRAAVLVDPERIDATAVGLSCSVFCGKEADAQEGFQVTLDKRLKWLFNGHGLAVELTDVIAGNSEEFDVAHDFDSSEDRNGR